MVVNRNVFLVGSDVAQCNKYIALLDSSSCNVKMFPSPEAFLENAESMTEGIMLLELCQTGMCCMELQSSLARRGADLPIIFISGRKDVRMAVKAMKAGAIDFLEKPFSNEELLASVKKAFSQATINKNNSLWIASLRECYNKLTAREREVMDHVANGMSSKVVAELLGISYRTVEIHRAKIIKKMGAKSLSDLVRKHAICQNTGLYRLRGGSRQDQTLTGLQLPFSSHHETEKIPAVSVKAKKPTMPFFHGYFECANPTVLSNSLQCQVTVLYADK